MPLVGFMILLELETDEGFLLCMEPLELCLSELVEGLEEALLGERVGLVTVDVAVA